MHSSLRAKGMMLLKRVLAMLRESSFGYGSLEVINATHLHWYWHRNQDGIAEVADDIFIVREPLACVNQNVAAPPTISVVPQEVAG